MAVRVMPADVRLALDDLLARGERGALTPAERLWLRSLARKWGLRLRWWRMDLNGPNAGIRRWASEESA